MSYRLDLSSHLDAIVKSWLVGWTINFEPHQVLGLQKLSSFLRETTWENVANIMQACGSGKTWEETALLEASRKTKTRHPNSVSDIIIYTEDAIRSGITDTLTKQWIDFWLWVNWKKPLDREVIVASIQTLQRTALRTNRLLSPDTPLIIGDEADLYTTMQRTWFLDQFPNALKIWFSATGRWNDGRTIEDAWWETIYRYSLAEAIQDWVLVRPNFLLLESSVSMDNPMKGRDFSEEKLEKLFIDAEIFHGVAAVYEAITKDNRKVYPTLVYVPGQELVRQTVQVFERKFWRSINIKWWTWDDTSTNQLENDIEDFRTWKIDVIVACDKWWRGVDLQNARLLIDAYAGNSPTKIEQRHTRVMRKNRDNPWSKEDCIIVQLIPKTKSGRSIIFPDIFTIWDVKKWEDIHHLSWWMESRRKNGSLYNGLPPDQLAAIRAALGENTWNHTLSPITDLKTRSWDIPMLGEEEFMEIEEEIYGTSGYFSRFFSVSISTIEKYTQWKSGVFVQKIDKGWRLIMVPVYPIAYFDELRKNRETTGYEIQDHDDIFIVDGEEYSSQKRCAEVLWVWVTQIVTYRKNSSIPCINVLCKSSNKFVPLYNYTRLRKIHDGRNIQWKTINPDITQLVVWDDIYHTASFLEGKYPTISRYMIENRVLKKQSIQWWNDVGRRVVWVYSEMAVAQLANTNNQIPTAEQDGMVIKDGVKYAWPTYLASLFWKPSSTIKSNCESKWVPFKEVKNSQNRASRYYLLSAVEALFSPAK
jgi:superfamily II DNA or RNA helicase